jgi:hypothetical protein
MKVLHAPAREALDNDAAALELDPGLLGIGVDASRAQPRRPPPGACLCGCL